MEDKVKLMLDRINFKIDYANKQFTEWNNSHSIRMAEIDGMIDMLSVITGKSYVITENGLEERN